MRWTGKAVISMACLALSAAASAENYPGMVRESLYVPVRDGTKLAVNLYRPASPSGVVDRQLPVIFMFTPYRARYRTEAGVIEEAALSDRLALQSLLRSGYIVAVADIRGKGASFGRRHGFQSRQEAQDGYDLVQWLSSLPYATGNVGMIGCSYLGGTTFHTASTAPPALKAVFIGATDLDKYDFVRNGGITAQFNTRPDEPLSDDAASMPVDADRDGTLLATAVAEHAGNTPMAALWYGMPYRDSVSEFTGNAFWQEAGVWRHMDAIRKAGIATYFWGNWHDEPTGQVILGAANMGGKFLAGPGDHCVPTPGFDFTGEVVRYFDHHLKGADNGIAKEPRAHYWVEGLDGKGGYVASDNLPGTDSKPRSWYLAGGEDKALGATAGAAAADRFSVDYDLPPVDYFAFWVGPMDAHGPAYTSQALAEPLKLVGFPIAHLDVKADRPDADIFVYLEQVAPGGSADVISFGRLKLSHRKTSKAPYDTLGLPWHSGLKADVAALPVGRTAKMNIVLTPVSRVVPRGARLRLVVTGADPRQRNLAQVMQKPPPQMTILSGGKDGSRVDLPVAP